MASLLLVLVMGPAAWAADPSHCAQTAVGRQTHISYELVGEASRSESVGVPGFYNVANTYYIGRYHGGGRWIDVNCATGDVMGQGKLEGDNKDPSDAGDCDAGEGDDDSGDEALDPDV